MLTNPMEIRLKGTKSVIKFANLNTAEDYGKVKSIKFPGGYCRFIWWEERRPVSIKTRCRPSIAFFVSWWGCI